MVWRVNNQMRERERKKYIIYIIYDVLPLFLILHWHMYTHAEHQYVINVRLFCNIQFILLIILTHWNKKQHTVMLITLAMTKHTHTKDPSMKIEFFQFLQLFSVMCLTNGQTGLFYSTINSILFLNSNQTQKNLIFSISIKLYASIL